MNKASGRTQLLFAHVRTIMSRHTTFSGHTDLYIIRQEGTTGGSAVQCLPMLMGSLTWSHNIYLRDAYIPDQRKESRWIPMRKEFEFRSVSLTKTKFQLNSLNFNQIKQILRFRSVFWALIISYADWSTYLSDQSPLSASDNQVTLNNVQS